MTMTEEWIPQPPPTSDDALAARVARLQEDRQRATPGRPSSAGVSRTRRHPAKTARYAAAGMSVLSVVGLTSLFVSNATGAAQQTGSAIVVVGANGGAAGSAATSDRVTASTDTKPSGSVGSSSAPRSPTSVVDGAVFSNRWGDVQVEATFAADGSLTEVTALQAPSGRKSDEINGYAVPILGDEATAIQSAQVDTVSGATYTSEGYRASLQSAIDAARDANLTTLA